MGRLKTYLFLLLIVVPSVCFGYRNHSTNIGISQDKHGQNNIKDFIYESDSILANKNWKNNATANYTETLDIDNNNEEGVTPTHNKVTENIGVKKGQSEVKITVSEKGQTEFLRTTTEDPKLIKKEMTTTDGPKDVYEDILRAERIRNVLIKYISPIFAAKPIGFLMAGGKLEEKLSGLAISDQCLVDTMTLFHDFTERKPYAAKSKLLVCR